MAVFDLFCYQCRPIRPAFSIDPESMRQDIEALNNMERHQEIVDDILRRCSTNGSIHKIPRHRWENTYLEYERYLKHPDYQSVDIKYNVEFLLSRDEDSKIESRYLLRINYDAFDNKLHQSAIAVIDNSFDQQRILIERNDNVNGSYIFRHILIDWLGRDLRSIYHLDISIKPVLNKNSFWNTAQRFQSSIIGIEFEIGYPNMGRTGETFLGPLKESLKSTYASGTIKYSIPSNEHIDHKDLGNYEPKENIDLIERRNSLGTTRDPVLEELIEYCRATGNEVTFIFNDGQCLKLQQSDRINNSPPRSILSFYKPYLDNSYSLEMSDEICKFQGQLLKRKKVKCIVTETLDKLKMEGI